MARIASPMQFHRRPDPNDKIGCSGCLQVLLLAVATLIVGGVAVWMLAWVVF